MPWWIDKQIVVYPHNEMLLNNKNEWVTDTHNMDESYMHYANRKKPHTEVYIHVYVNLETAKL